MNRRLSTPALVIITGLAALPLAACGSSHSGHSSAATPTSSAPQATSGTAREIDIEMSDYAYAPNNLRVAKGETIRLRFTNNGKAKHEAIIGDEAAQASHAAMMSAEASTSTMHVDEPGATPHTHDTTHMHSGDSHSDKDGHMEEQVLQCNRRQPRWH